MSTQQYTHNIVIAPPGSGKSWWTEHKHHFYDADVLPAIKQVYKDLISRFPDGHNGFNKWWDNPESTAVKNSLFIPAFAHELSLLPHGSTLLTAETAAMELGDVLVPGVKPKVVLWVPPFIEYQRNHKMRMAHANGKPKNWSSHDPQKLAAMLKKYYNYSFDPRVHEYVTDLSSSSII